MTKQELDMQESETRVGSQNLDYLLVPRDVNINFAMTEPKEWYYRKSERMHSARALLDFFTSCRLS